MQNRDMQVRSIMETTCSFKDLFSLCVCVWWGGAVFLWVLVVSGKGHWNSWS